MGPRFTALLTVVPFLIHCASTQPASEPARSTDPMQRAQALFLSFEFEPVTPMLPPGLSSWMKQAAEEKGRWLSASEIESLRLATPSGDLDAETTAILMVNLWGYEMRRAESPDVALEYALYKQVESIADIASTELMQYLLLKTIELDEDSRAEAKTLFERAPTISERAQKNRSRALGTLMSGELTRRQLADAAFLVGELDSCELASALWSGVGELPGDSPTGDDYLEQSALFHYAGSRTGSAPQSVITPARKRAQRAATLAAAAREEDVRRYYHGVALYEASCEAEAQRVWTEIENSALQALATATPAAGLELRTARTALATLDRKTLSRELRRDFGRLMLVNELARSGFWLAELQSDPEGSREGFEELKVQILQSAEDYGAFSPDERAVLVAIFTVLSAGEGPFDPAAQLEAALEAASRLRREFPDSSLVMGGALLAAAFGASTGADSEALFASLSAGKVPAAEEDLYDMATVLARLNAARTLAFFSELPAGEIQESARLRAFLSILQAVLGEGAVTWGQVKEEIGAVDADVPSTQNNHLVSAVLAGDCESLSRVLEAVDGDEMSVFMRFNLSAIMGLAACVEAAEPESQLLRFTSLVDEVEAEVPKLERELSRWRALILEKTERSEEARELLCAEAREADVVGEDAAVVLQGDATLGIGSENGEPQIQLGARATPFLVLRAPMDGLPKCR